MKGRAAAKSRAGHRGLSHQAWIRDGKAAQARQVSLLSSIKPQVLIVLMQGKAECQLQPHSRGALHLRNPKAGPGSARISEGPRAGNGS